MNLENKRIVITGATSGIGQETLKLLQAIPGVQIIAVGREIEHISVNHNVTPYKCDVSISENIDKLFDFSVERMGGIDVFIANAGFAYYEKTNKADWHHIESIFQTNVFSPIYSYQKMVELNPKNRFSFIITASAVSFFALPYYTLYSSSKFALQGFLDGIRYEIPKNAHIGLVYPVATKTAFFEKASITSKAKEPWPTQMPEVVAKAIVNGIKKDKQKIMPSNIFALANIIGRIFPSIIRMNLKSQAIEPMA